MNTYVREMRGMLENLGFVRRSDASWMGLLVLGVGFGAVAGAVATALLTPTNGKETRKLARSRAKEIASRAEQKISAIKSSHTNGAKEQLHA